MGGEVLVVVGILGHCNVGNGCSYNCGNSMSRYFLRSYIRGKKCSL